MTASKASTELSAETNSAAQDDVKAGLPSLPHQFSDESLLRMFESVKKEVDSEVPDVTTEDGRKRIKSLAAKISKSKTALDTPMRDYLRILKTQPKVLEASARESKARFDQLRDKLLAPLEDAQTWQDEKLAWLDGIPVWCATNPTSTDLSALLAEVESFTLDDIWPELLRKFSTAHEAAITTLKVTLERVSESERQAARLAELEAQAEVQRQVDRDRLIAEEAASKAIAMAEEKSRLDREESNRRVAESAHREEQAAIREAQAKKAAIEAEEKRISDATMAEERAKQAEIEAEERSKLAQDKAVEAEKLRAIEAEKEQEKLAKARADDKELRVKVNRANLVVLIAAGFSAEDGKKFISMVAKGELPDIKIHY